jgi:POLQ-like helicase
MARSHVEVGSGPRSRLLRSLGVEAEGVCPVLTQTVPVGVAYHHSGLTADERRLIEEGFSRGELNVLCCTSTLAAGVNLPARRVILRSPYIANQVLSHSQYKQMVGRAGRKGLTECGDSILIASPSDRDKVIDLLASPYDSCDSSLLSEDSALSSLILSLVGLKLVATTSDLQTFLRATLYYQQTRDHTRYLSRCQEMVASLTAEGYITMETVEESRTRLSATPLGRAAVKGSIPVNRAGQVYRELSHAQSSLVLSTNLHLLFLATPTDHAPSIRPNWLVFFKTVECDVVSEAPPLAPPPPADESWGGRGEGGRNGWSQSGTPQ